MQITKHKMVTLDYTVKIESGEVVDTSKGDEPLSYIHGMGNMIPGFEAALEGRQEPESFSFSVGALEGYGERQPDLLFSVPREKFVDFEDLSVGVQFQIETPQGWMPMSVSSIDGDTVELDANHPLAGHAMTFEVAILEVRDATEKELSEASACHTPGCGCSCDADQESACKPE
jgi:FKBP-type peptidyl-prolyl cis-trans isomerase SlyD